MVRTISFVKGYVRRVIDAELDAVISQLPAILLDGPKGVGKTTTALRRARTVRRLDRQAERAVVANDPRVIAGDKFPLLIDEWHRVPGVFDAVRSLVDEGAPGGSFLLTGSAPRQGTHSGAGRITTVRMRPLALSERIEALATVSLTELLTDSVDIRGRSTVDLAEYIREIVAGGFPGMRHLDGSALSRQLKSYTDRIVDHDIVEAGHVVRRPETVRAWLRAYAASIATTTSWEKIRNAATPELDNKPGKETTAIYSDLLTALRVLDPLPAWQPSNNHLGQLTLSSKHHLADPALAARLVHLSATQLGQGMEPTIIVPRDGTFLGALFESLCALSVRTFAQVCDAEVYHLRDRGGRHEIDLIVETGAGVLAIEAKLSSTITDKDVRHLLWLKERLGADCIDTVVLNTGPEAYRRPDGVAVVPLALLGV